MSASRIQVIGQSHVKALRDATRVRAPDLRQSEKIDIALHWLRKERPQGPVGNIALEESLKRAAELEQTDLLAVSLFGGYHNVVGLLNHENPFTILTEEAGSPEETRQTVIPNNVMRDIFKTVMNGRKLQRIKDSTQAPVYHLATPPPKKDADFILSRTTAYRKRSVRESGISPAPLRLKLWQMEMEVLSGLCRELGITLLPPPARTTDEEGYLLPVCYAPDATHANAVYGELVLRQLEDLVGQETGECVDAG